VGKGYPAKPLPRELASITAVARAKKAKKEGVPPLCGSCSVKKHTICPNTGHVICSKRKDTGWVPIPFTAAACGLFISAEVIVSA
jgi:hypothetical protein